MMRSRKIVVSALFLWSVSLLFPAIIIYAQNKGPITGIYILLNGWFGFNAAWYANIFFIWAAFKIFGTGKAPVVSSVIAVLLALDTFRFEKVLMNAGGSYSDVFGYGLGAVVWGLAILLVLVASGQRYSEQLSESGNSGAMPATFLRNAGFVLIGVYSIFAIGKYFNDHTGYAHPSDASLLTIDVIKRGSLCRAPVMKPLEPALKVNGPFEVGGNSSKFWSNPLNLLERGFPIIRFNGYDFYVVDGAIEAKKAEGHADARLYVSQGERSNLIRINIADIGDDGKIVRQANFRWNAYRKGGTCPPQKYGSEEDPKSLLNASIVGFDKKKEIDLSDRINGRWLRETMSTYNKYPKIISTENISKKEYFKTNRDEINNTGCGSRFYNLPDFYKRDNRFKKLGAAFMVDGRIKFLSDSIWYGVFFCSGEHGYLVRHSVDINVFQIRKITYPDIKPVWQGKIAVDGDYRQVLSIEEKENSIVLDVLNRKRQLITMKIDTF
jgi:hypothetical protein